MPFGGRWDSAAEEISDNRYRFTGKEIQTVGDVGFYDFGARMYDTGIGRWSAVDPKSENYYTSSPYVYCANNPVKFIDPDGENYYLNIFSGRIEYRGGSYDLFDRGLLNLAGDKAKIGDIQDELSSRGFQFSFDASIPGGFIVNTSDAITGWMMSQIFSPENVSTILSLGIGSELAAERSAQSAAIKGTLNSARKGITVIGTYPRYIELAKELNANKFQMPIEIWNKMTEAERWAANKRFLDRAIARGDRFRLTTSTKNIDGNSYYYREVRYLKEQGYRESPDGRFLIK